MELVFNKDGSIKLKKIDASIQQGNVGVNHIDVAIEGYEPEEYIATFLFVLPNGDGSTLIARENVSIVADGTTYQGVRATLTEAQTYLAGILKMNAVFTDAFESRLFTYTINLTINPTAYFPDINTITGSQYANLISAMNTKEDKFSTRNARYYPTLVAAESEKTQLAYGQIAVVVENNKITYYKKDTTTGELVKIITTAVEIVTVEADATSGTFTEEEYNKLLSSFDVVIYKEPNEIFRLNDRTLDNDKLVYSHIGYECEIAENEGIVKLIIIDTNTREWRETFYLLPGWSAEAGGVLKPFFMKLKIGSDLDVEENLYAGDIKSVSLELYEGGTLGDNLKEEIRKLINE